MVPAAYSPPPPPPPLLDPLPVAPEPPPAQHSAKTVVTPAGATHTVVPVAVNTVAAVPIGACPGPADPPDDPPPPPTLPLAVRPRPPGYFTEAADPVPPAAP